MTYGLVVKTRVLIFCLDVSKTLPIMKRETKGFYKERFIMYRKLTEAEEKQVDLIVNTVNIGIPVLLVLNVGLYVNDYLRKKKENDRRIKEREEALERFDEVLKKV